jgi:Secretion system C-terminal sorting domain
VYNVSGTTIKLRPAVLTNSDDFSFAIAENVTTDFTLLNQDFAVVAVRFNPLTAAPKTATLSITASTDGGQSITTTARITGRGAPLKVFPLDFGTSVTGKGLAVPALVANYGTRTARLTAQRFQSGNQGMSVARGQTVFLSPGDTTAVLLSALQLAEGQYFDTLRVESDIDTAFAPVQLVTRKGDTTDIIVQMGLRAVPDSAAPGSPVTLELFIRGEENLNVLRQRNAPFSGSIRYDRRVLYIQPNQSRTEIARNSETQNTFQRAKILLTPWDGRETTLMKIPALAMLSEIDSTELVVENIAWNDPSGTNNVFVTAPQNGRFKVALRRVGGNRLLRQVDKTLLVTEIAPNPANDAVQTTFTLKQSDTVTLALYNALGNMVLSRAGEEFEAGNHTVKFSTANLPNGVYALRLTSEQGSDQMTVVINR